MDGVEFGLGSVGGAAPGGVVRVPSVLGLSVVFSRDFWCWVLFFVEWGV